MSLRTIPCIVSDEYVKGAGVPVGAAGSHNDVVLELTFSPLWEGLAKKITWYDALMQTSTFTILTTNLLKDGETDVYLVPIPPEPKAVAGDMTMTIKGVTVENGVETRATLSTSCQFRVLPAEWDDDADETQDVNPTQAEQLQAEIDEIKEDILDARAAATEAAASASAAAVSAQGASGSQRAAAASQVAAANSEANALVSKNAAQSWAVGGTGTREGEDIDNAKYWAEQARSAAGGGVVTFNGRDGSVVPQSGDYTAAMVGAIPASEKGAPDGVAELDATGKVPAAQLPATMTPAAHADSHKTGGSDPIAPADIGAVSKSGDTMTGALSFVDSGLPDITGMVRVLGNGTRLVNANSSGGSDLVLDNSTATTARLRIITNGKLFSIFGQHNKPTGSYTGNGSANGPVVSIGGITNEASLLVVLGNGWTAIVGYHGSVAWQNTGTSPKVIPSAQCTFRGGVLTIATADGALNASAKPYTYQVL